MGDLEGALDAHEQDLAVSERLAAADPGDAERQRELSVIWNKIGGLKAARGDADGALRAHEKDSPSPGGWRPRSPATLIGSTTSASAGTMSATYA